MSCKLESNIVSRVPTPLLYTFGEFGLDEISIGMARRVTRRLRLSRTAPPRTRNRSPDHQNGEATAIKTIHQKNRKRCFRSYRKILRWFSTSSHRVVCRGQSKQIAPESWRLNRTLRTLGFRITMGEGYLLDIQTTGMLKTSEVRFGRGGKCLFGALHCMLRGCG